MQASPTFNPPRKAKRPIPPELLVSTSDEDALEVIEDEFDEEEGVGPNASKRARTTRGGGPTTTTANSTPKVYLSRSAREHARRVNHSKIEKRRRVKINDTLDELRKLIPPGWKPGSKNVSVVDGGGGGGSEQIEEKDKGFKLDVLENTVAYLIHLQKKVEELERLGSNGSRDSGLEGSREKDKARDEHEDASHLPAGLLSPVSPKSPSSLVSSGTSQVSTAPVVLERNAQPHQMEAPYQQIEAGGHPTRETTTYVHIHGDSHSQSSTAVDSLSRETLHHSTNEKSHGSNSPRKTSLPSIANLLNDPLPISVPSSSPSSFDNFSFIPPGAAVASGTNANTNGRTRKTTTNLNPSTLSLSPPTFFAATNTHNTSHLPSPPRSTSLTSTPYGIQAPPYLRLPSASSTTISYSPPGKKNRNHSSPSIERGKEQELVLLETDLERDAASALVEIFTTNKNGNRSRSGSLNTSNASPSNSPLTLFGPRRFFMDDGHERGQHQQRGGSVYTSLSSSGTRLSPTISRKHVIGSNAGSHSHSGSGLNALTPASVLGLQEGCL